MTKRDLYIRIMESVAVQVKKAINQLDEGECCCDCGGVDAGAGSFNTPFNTVGVGNVVPAGHPCMTGADFANDAFNGSGDRFDNGSAATDRKKKSTKKKKTHIYTKR